MQLAWQQNGMHGPGVQPWHIRATWQIVDDKGRPDGKPGDEGSWEEWWAGPGLSKTIYGPAANAGADGPSSQAVTGAAGKAPEYWIDSFISDLLLNPAPSAEELAHSRLKGSRTKNGHVKLDCVTATANFPTDYAIKKFCFADGVAALRIEENPVVGLALNSIVEFQGRYLARDIRVYRVGMPAIEIRVDPIEALDSATEQKLFPSSNATLAKSRVDLNSGVIAGRRISGNSPNYSAIAKAEHIQGTVSLWAIIGKDGVIHDLEVIGGPPMLQGASLEAVKTWRYKPYLLGGVPVEGRVKDRRSGVSLPVAVGIAFTMPPQSGLA
ncbi:MAG TPA: energy transducer TonB [Acidobacteriaceae bacterium]|nr:energy transducer TonB [Acidobacteriaceae bacterium]